MQTARIITAIANHLHPGMRCWQDVYFYAGWRIQKHARTGQYRAVPPSWRDPIFVAENFEECGAVIKQKKAAGLKPAHDHLVLIIPGLGGVPAFFMPLCFMIRRSGYDCMIWYYGSNHTNVAGHAANLGATIARLDGIKTVSFVTHSLGGLILRVLLADAGSQAAVPIGRIVMIAPPHGGSFIADLVHDRLKLKKLFAWVCGHVGHDLTSAGAQALPPVTAPVGIITGGINYSDGLVTISSALVPAAGDITHMRGWSHTAILWNPETGRQVLRFLRTGQFLKDEAA